MRSAWYFCFSSLVILFGLTSGSTAADSTSQPRPVPLTRPEMKELLEDMKQRTPRFPLPALTEADKEALGERADSYESRLRYHYFGQRGGDQNRRPDGAGQGARGPNAGGPGSRGNSDPKMTLDYKFKTQLFWIVSRANNCQY